MGAERTKGFKDSLCVLKVWTHPNVEVLGCADVAMGGQSVRTDD